MIYVNDDIACKELRKNDLYYDIERIFIEISIRKKKCLIFGGYNPHKRNMRYFLDNIGKSLDKYISIYDNILLLGDFNSDTSDNHMNEFLKNYCLKSLIKEPTGYKNVTKPTCIDLILTNKKISFQNNTTIETGLSDFHKMTITVLEIFFQKLPAIITYKNYKKNSIMNLSVMNYEIK